MTLRTMIADDEPLARERLRMLLASDPEIDVVAECRNGSEVVQSLKAAKTDLLFLDIRMPGRDGFEVIEAIGPASMPITVFVTAHNEHAVNAFEVHALDYLLKPIERKRLEQTLARVKERVQLQEAFAVREQISSAVEAIRQVASHPERPQRFLTKSGNTASVVAVSDIEWIEAADYYVCLHAGGKRHLLRESIRALETKLDPKMVEVYNRGSVNANERARDSPGRTIGRLGSSVHGSPGSPESEWLAEANWRNQRFEESFFLRILTCVVSHAPSIALPQWML